MHFGPTFKRPICLSALEALLTLFIPTKLKNYSILCFDPSKCLLVRNEGWVCNYDAVKDEFGNSVNSRRGHTCLFELLGKGVMWV